MGHRHGLPRRAGWGSALASLLCVASVASAQTPDPDFYRGKTIRLIVGAAPGAAYDFAGRVVATHLGRYIPGQPSIVVENMPGASSIIMLNHLYNRAARDGTAMGMSLSGVVHERRLQGLSHNGSNVQFDIARMNWIGTPAQQPFIYIVWGKTPLQTFKDLVDSQATFATTSQGGDNWVMPVLTNQLLGTRIKLVAGYKGVNDIFLAMEQGEVQGTGVVLSSLLGKEDWMRDHKARVLLQFGVTRNPAVKDVPTAIELATSEDDRRMLAAYATKFRTTYPIMMPPEVPPERVKMMRTAFDAAMKDPQLIADAKKFGIDVDPVSGEDIGKIVAELDALPQPIVDRLRKLLEQ
ncbi:tripartite tricarboxylate transporter substrate-binding protein [Roseiarcaceae bacterium H3SJ34-1]|uniref:Bug family tripartite tricarboxylate transporter substrate binding protein n=1 Tax=Terripilifer ovatus TaxID=3032367 RepID=UPI003AB96232|nr:tripartite tricarboxylate transporter substrate-binding protein [Roseiarcaceae bacterium H3SJ34-1]